MNNKAKLLTFGGILFVTLLAGFAFFADTGKLHDSQLTGFLPVNQTSDYCFDDKTRHSESDCLLYKTSFLNSFRFSQSRPLNIFHGISKTATFNAFFPSKQLCQKINSGYNNSLRLETLRSMVLLI